MQQQAQQAEQQFRRRLFLLLFLRRSIKVLTPLLFVGGSWLLFLRIIDASSLRNISWNILPVLVLLGLLVAAIQERRRGISPTKTAAGLDACNRCGGLLAGAAEGIRLGEWEQQLPATYTQPALHWQGKRSLLLLGLAVFYLFTVHLLPARYVQHPLSPPPMEIGDTVKNLEAKVKLLEEEKILEEQIAAELKESLRKTQENAESTDPGAALESLDRVDEKLDKEAQKHAQAALAELNDAELAQALSEALAQAEENGAFNLDTPNVPNEKNGQKQSKMQNEAFQELQKLLKKLEKNALSPNKLSSELLATLKKLNAANKSGQCPNLSPKDLRRLAKSLKACNGDIQKQIARLCKANLLSGEWKKRCCGKGKKDGKAAAALLAYLAQQNPELSATLATVCLGIPGQGGLSRGRGDAPLTWSDGTDETGVSYKAQWLPDTQPPDLNQSRLLGVSHATPKTNDAPTPITGGTLANARAGGGSAATSPILPRHRRTVRNFFSRAKK